MTKKYDVELIDDSNMRDVMLNFPDQVREALEIGENAPSFDDISDILILGMGGSAIGGDLLRTFVNSINKNIRIRVSRSYELPPDVNKNTTIIASSYSGGTEETISAFKDAVQITDRIAVISTGGELTELASGKNIPVVKLPEGYQPRAALGFSFFPMLMMMMRSDVFTDVQLDHVKDSIVDAQLVLMERAKLYSDIDNDRNAAFRLAGSLSDKVPVFYSSSDKLDTVNLRWRGQIQENAKQIAFGNLLPEMNHNEINGWLFPQSIKDILVPVFLRDRDDHPKVKARITATDQILSESGYVPIHIESDARYYLTRIFDLIYLADWVSLYLSGFNEVDPTPIPFISKLKSKMSKL